MTNPDISVNYYDGAGYSPIGSPNAIINHFFCVCELRIIYEDIIIQILFGSIVPSARKYAITS